MMQIIYESTLQIIHSVVLRIKLVLLYVPSGLFWFALVIFCFC